MKTQTAIVVYSDFMSKSNNWAAYRQAVAEKLDEIREKGCTIDFVTESGTWDAAYLHTIIYYREQANA